MISINARFTSPIISIFNAMGDLEGRHIVNRTSEFAAEMGRSSGIAHDRRSPAVGMVIFADAHFNLFWEHVEAVCGGDTINPNRELRDFVERMNQLGVSRPVVNLGDSVDYVVDGYEAVGPQADNRSLFYSVLGRLTFPYFELAGNHDHRFGAYNVRAWGLEHVNVCRDTLRIQAEQIGHTRIRSPVAELRAILPLGYEADPLAGFRGVRQPTLRTIGGYDCLLLNTHGDGFLTLRGVARLALDWIASARRGTDKHGISISAYGLTRRDLAAVSAAHARAVGDGPLLHLMHAPILNGRGEAGERCFSFNGKNFLHTRRRFGLDHHVMANGAAEMLLLLRKKALGVNCQRRSMIVIAGHTHTARYILIDAETLIAREVVLTEFNAAWDDPRFIKHATVLPLGVIDPYVAQPRLGYAIVDQNGIHEEVTGSFAGPAGATRQRIAAGNDGLLSSGSGN